MDSKARAKRRRVFLAYRRIFTRNLARMRKKKAIRTIAQKHDWLSYQKYIGVPDVNEVVRILRSLLINRIFESEELVSKEFPDLESQHGQPTKRDEARNVVVEGREKHDVSHESSVKMKYEEISDGAANIPREGTSIRILIYDLNKRSYPP